MAYRDYARIQSADWLAFPGELKAIGLISKFPNLDSFAWNVSIKRSRYPNREWRIETNEKVLKF